MFADTVSFALSFVYHDRNFLLTTEVIESLFGCLVCYIVWAQATSTQFNSFDITIVQEHDGRQRLICNRRNSEITATSEFTSSYMSINTEIDEELVEDKDLY
jgi:hypothetical protein